jgi:lipopolysaccharide transport system ATP-binding protein
MNATILGMKKREIDRKFDEIVDFSGVEKFLDTPIKRYSSGMQVRLAFSVAAHLEPEILIVDEVLAVGDAEFQKKCLGKMQDASRWGKTVLFVSHNIEAISTLCSRCLLLDNARLALDSLPSVAIRAYRTNDANEGAEFKRSDAHNTSEAWISNAWMEQHGYKIQSVRNNEALDIYVQVSASACQRLSFEVMVRDSDYRPVLFAPLGLAYGMEHELCQGSSLARIQVRLPYLAVGRYHVDLILAETGRRFVDYIENALAFEIENNFIEGTGWSFQQSRSQGCCLLQVDCASILPGRDA